MGGMHSGGKDFVRTVLTQIKRTDRLNKVYPRVSVHVTGVVGTVVTVKMSVTVSGL